MAHIRANTKNGKIVSYRFTVCLGRDCNGKQIRKYTTWPIPPDTSTAKAKKAAERAADIWEQELINEYHKKLEAESARHIRYRQKNATMILFPSSMMSGFPFKLGMVSISPKPSLSMRVWQSCSSPALVAPPYKESAPSIFSVALPTFAPSTRISTESR